MKIQFFGAVRTVTGSMHVLEVNGDRVMVDCGLFQGKRSEAIERNRRLPVAAREITSALLTHAHIDHSGNLPNLVKSGFRGQIYATAATKDLCEVMLRDSGAIQEKDAEYLNRKPRKGEPPVEPIYTEEDAKACLPQIEGLPYERPFPLARGLTATFLDAGHILGAAITVLDVEEDGRRVRLALCFDLGRGGMPILRDPMPLPPDVDYIVTESTYGDRVHAPAADMKAQLRDAVRRTVERGGKVIVPAFSVGRTQNLVYYLHQLTLEGTLPPVPIFVDSPLSSQATRIYSRHPECYDAETRQFLADRRDPFGFARLTYCTTQQESMALNDLKKPCVIVSASGMCEAGRILHHLKHNVEDPRSTVLIVGFQAENTLGRRLVDGAPEIKIFGVTYARRCEVATMDGLSAHADRNEILAYLAGREKRVKGVFIVHGEEDQALGLASHLRAKGFARVEVPTPKQRYDL